MLWPVLMVSRGTRPPGNQLVGSVENMGNYRLLVCRIYFYRKERLSSSAIEFIENSLKSLIRVIL